MAAPSPSLVPPPALIGSLLEGRPDRLMACLSPPVPPDVLNARVPPGTGWAGYAPLHVACGCDVPDPVALTLVRQLLNAGASCHQRSTGHEVPLTVAVRQNRTTVVRALLDAGADPTAETVPPLGGPLNGPGTSPVHTAAWLARDELLGQFLDHGVSPNHAGDRPLSLLLMLMRGLADRRRPGVIASLDRLLDAGADPNLGSRANDRASPLTVAASAGHADVVERLLDAGAHRDHAERSTVPGRRFSARGGAPNGPRLELPTVSDGWTALHLAAALGHAPVVRLLLDRGASPAARCGAGWRGPDDPGSTPLDLARENHRAQVLVVFEQRALGRTLDALATHVAPRRRGRL